VLVFLSVARQASIAVADLGLQLKVKYIPACLCLRSHKAHTPPPHSPTTRDKPRSEQSVKVNVVNTLFSLWLSPLLSPLCVLARKSCSREQDIDRPTIGGISDSPFWLGHSTQRHGSFGTWCIDSSAPLLARSFYVNDTICWHFGYLAF